MSLSIGYPNAGRQVRAKHLKDTRYLHVKSNSREKTYGHPALVLMLGRSAREIGRLARGSIMMVGDLSAKSGGQLQGHVSHQSGRDADVGFYMTDRDGRYVEPDRFISFGSDGLAKDASGYVFDDWRNWLLVRAWVRDKRAGISHIFVSAPLRRRLLDYAHSHKPEAKYVDELMVLLKRPDAAEHDDHFHVRVACPSGLEGLCHEESR
jgi:penicillin-insensitive murein endopeptidase